MLLRLAVVTAAVAGVPVFASGVIAAVAGVASAVAGLWLVYPRLLAGVAVCVALLMTGAATVVDRCCNCICG